MNLMADWLMPYEGVQDIRLGTRAKCRVRIYEHEAEPAALEPLILTTELEDNAGESIVSSAEVVVGKLLAALEEVMDLSTSRTPTFVSHQPLEVTKAVDSYWTCQAELRWTLISPRFK